MIEPTELFAIGIDGSRSVYVRKADGSWPCLPTHVEAARPTERGAVEDDLEAQIAEALDESLEAEWTTAAGARHVMGFLRAKGIIPATNQAAEVERLREALAVAKRAILKAAQDTLWCGDSPVETVVDRIDALLAEADGQAVLPLPQPCGDLRVAAIKGALCLSGFAGEGLCVDGHEDPATAWSRIAVAIGLPDGDDDDLRRALATQPATGRTMGGEDGLREALEDIETMLTPAGNVWLGTEPKWQTDAYARARAALQNGGE